MKGLNSGSLFKAYSVNSSLARLKKCVNLLVTVICSGAGLYQQQKRKERDWEIKIYDTTNIKQKIKKNKNKNTHVPTQFVLLLKSRYNLQKILFHFQGTDPSFCLAFLEELMQDDRRSL